MTTHVAKCLFVVCVFAFTAACSDDDTKAPASDRGVVGGDGGATPDSSVAGDSGGAKADTGGAKSDGGTTGVPTEKNAIFTWLKAGSYKSWDAEKAIHASTGPHGRVRTYFNAALVASFKAGNAAHPKGAAAVKELHGTGSTVTGWVVEVKTDADSKAGANWYWYENFSTTSAAAAVVSAKGSSLCTGCHSAGKDYVRTPHPFTN